MPYLPESRLPAALEKSFQTQSERLESDVKHSVGILDQRFYELAEQLKRWSEGTIKIMKLKTRQGHSAFSYLDPKVVTGFRTVFGKWSLEIIAILVARRRVRFEELHRALRGISSRVLSQKLSGMQNAGFIKRTIVEGRPPGVLYELSERGFALVSLGRPVVLFLLVEAAKQGPL